MSDAEFCIPDAIAFLERNGYRVRKIPIPKLQHKDLSGVRFGRLIALYRCSFDHAQRRPRWMCQCDCGAEKEVSSKALLNGMTKSCGCLRRANGARLAEIGRQAMRQNKQQSRNTAAGKRGGSGA